MDIRRTGTNGSLGSAGGDITATIVDDTQSTSSALAIGGNGGAGVAGTYNPAGVGGAAGAGGDGGRARAEVTNTINADAQKGFAGAAGGAGGASGAIGGSGLDPGVSGPNAGAAAPSGAGGAADADITIINQRGKAEARGGASGGAGGLVQGSLYSVGLGGAGGDANAKARATSAGGASLDIANATAVAESWGGNGGYGDGYSLGRLGVSNPGSGAFGGNGGSANAFAEATATNSASSQATALGGNGGKGRGSSVDGQAGAGGGAGAQARSISLLGDAFASVRTTGGAGGDGWWPSVDGGAGAAAGPATAYAKGVTAIAMISQEGGAGGRAVQGRGGVGGDATLDNAVGGSGQTSLSLSQHAQGGRGGFGDASLGVSGAGGFGKAYIHFDATKGPVTLERLDVHNSAYGGDSGTGTAGGAAKASSVGVNAFGVTTAVTTVTARAVGGQGGFTSGPGTIGGAGGQVLGALAKGYGWIVKATSEQRGGNAGDAEGAGTIGGAGASVDLVDQVGGRAGSLLSLSQKAQGGNGGIGARLGGKGGFASNRLVFNDVATNKGSKAALSGTVRATGGNGGTTRDFEDRKLGGAADARIELTGARWVFAAAEAQGGVGGQHLIAPGVYTFGKGADAKAHATARIDGTFAAATATAHATATGGGSGLLRGGADATAIALGQNGQTATAMATGLGSSGTARAEASTTAAIGFVTSVKAAAQAQIRGPATTQATAQLTTLSLESPGKTIQSYAAATATPLLGDLNPFLKANPEVAAPFLPLVSSVLAAGAMGATNDRDAPGPHEYSGTNSFVIDTTTRSGDLVLGLLDMAALGNGFFSVALSVAIDGVAVFNQSFTTLAAATPFFDDTVVNLGDVRNTKALTVAVTLTVRVDTANDAFGMNYILGTTNDEVDTLAPAKPGMLDLAAASDHGISDTDNITNDISPVLTGMAEPDSTILLYDNGVLAGLLLTGLDGRFTLVPDNIPADGVHAYTIEARDWAGNVSARSDPLTVVIDTTIEAPSGLDLTKASDTGALSNDDLTRDNTPTIAGRGEAGATVTLFAGGTALGKSKVSAAGVWAITSKTLADGTHTLTAKQTDLAGNVSAVSAGLTVAIDTKAPAAPVVTALTPAALVGVTDPGTRVTLRQGAVVLGAANTNAAGVWSIATVFAPGSHAIELTAADAAGNAAVTKHTIVIGTAGADTITGGAGADLMAGQGGDDTYDVNDANDRVFESGGGGVDTVRASVGYTLPTGARVEFLRAAAANLTLGGNEQRDRIFGSSGADTLNGFAGADTLTGGLGPDVFRVSEASHSSPAGPDVVTDFSIAEGDLLDLSLIDANPASGADDAFTFIGSAAFTGVAGQLRAVVAGGVTTVSGDITGDGGRISRSRWRGAMR